MAQQTRPAEAAVRNRNRACSATLLLVACALLSAAGCGSGKADDPKESPTPTPSVAQPSKSADPTEAAKNEAVSTYKKYWKEMERLYADRHGDGAGLKLYAAAAALEGAKSDAKSMHDKGNIITGSVAVGTPTVTKADIDRRVPNATISSCLDVTGWKVVDSTTKKPVSLPQDRLTKYVVVSTIERWPEGWRVIKDEPQGKKC